MGMVACKDCGKEISDSAKACPGCGAPTGKGGFPWRWVLGIPAGLFTMFMIYGLSIPEEHHRAREIREVCVDMARKSGQNEQHCWEEEYRQKQAADERRSGGK